MNFEKFTQNAQSAVMDCQNIGVQEGHQQLDGEHLHLALMLQQDGLIPKLVSFLGVNTGEIVGELQGEIERLPRVQGGNDNMYSTRRLNQLLIIAEKIASDFKDEYVSVEHIYLALLDEKNTTSGRIFRKHNITKDGFRKALSKVRGKQRAQSQNPEDK